MLRIAIVIIPLFIFKHAIAQVRPDFTESYFGKSRFEVKDKITRFVQAFQYEGYIDETDSTIVLTTSQRGFKWKIVTLFNFGKNDSCETITYGRCDKFKESVFDNTFKNNMKLTRVSDTAYVTVYSIGELYEIVRNDTCLVYRVRKHGLSKEAYEALVQAAKNGG
jgi:hypothetical protein